MSGFRRGALALFLAASSLSAAPAAADGVDASPLLATAVSTAGDAAAAVDGDAASAWRAPVVAGGQRLVLDLGRVREFGGLVLDWLPGAHASRYHVQLSVDGVGWQDARMVAAGDGGRDWIALPESEARYLALDLLEGPGAGFGLAEATIRPLAFSARPGDFVRAVAADLPRGRWPRGFSGEQAYSTLLGVDGGLQQGLLGEDGAAGLAHGGFSIEPFLRTGGRLVTWADVSARQSLQDGYLPLPSVDWRHEGFSLRTTAFAAGTPAHSQLVLRYRLANTGGQAREFDLALAVRPLQVAPPSQRAGTVGGVSRIERIAVDGGMVSVDGVPRVFAKQVPAASFATTFDAGDAVSHLAAGRLPATTRVVDDPTGLASAALVYRMRLGPGEVASVEVMVPMTGGSAPARRWWDAEELQREVAAQWRATLDRVRLDLPAQGQALADSLRTARAHMLVSRAGPGSQPRDSDASAGTLAFAPGDALAPACTPCEWRDVGAFVRQGLRAQAWDAAQRLLAGRAPPAWNQWPGVMAPTPPAPAFPGDLPQAGVASDFVRSALDMFAHGRESDGSLVLAAGVPVEWFDHGVGLRGLPTPHGVLGYSLRRTDGVLVLEVDEGITPPPGGLVLPWPWPGAPPGAATIDGRPAAWRDGVLRIDAVPARIEIQAGDIGGA